MFFLKKDKFLNNKKQTKEPASWKNITQTTRKDPITPAAIKRRWILILKSIGAVGACIIFGFFIWFLWSYIVVKSESVPLINTEKSLKNIVFKTDGVLTQRWLQERLEFLKNKSLMQIDIFELKNNLESMGQIKIAIIERKFPDTLKIQVQEYHPAFRLTIPLKKQKNGKDQYASYLVSKEGHVYQGANYSQATLKNLPYLTGVKLRKVQGKFLDIPGIQGVSQLLEKAKLQYPKLYSRWKSISLEKFNPDPEAVGSLIIIQTRSWGKIYFASTQFDQQLSRLNYVIQYSDSQQLKFMESIDLTLQDQASLKLKNGY